MRAPLGRNKVRELMRVLGYAARGPGRVYLVGGTSSVLEGWRDATVDANLKLDPEPPGVFEALRRIQGRARGQRRAGRAG